MKENNRNIPRIIHYCWFGRGEMPDNIKGYIKGWKSLLPDYEIVEWNEDNFSIENAPVYVQEAYKVKKYAFVSDYVRIKALYEHGGVYLDTDIEIVRRFDELLENRELVVGFESDCSLETAFIASVPGNKYIGEFCGMYNERKFIMEDGSFDMSVINQHFSKLLSDRLNLDLNDESFRILENGSVAIYPREYFAAFDISNWHIKPTENTYTIHHMNASWSTNKKKIYFGIIHIMQRIFGYEGYDRIKAMWECIKNGRNHRK